MPFWPLPLNHHWIQSGRHQLKCTLNIKALAITEHNTSTGVADKLLWFHDKVAQGEHTSSVYLPTDVSALIPYSSHVGKNEAWNSIVMLNRILITDPLLPSLCVVPDWSEITGERKKRGDALREAFARGRLCCWHTINNVNSMWSHLKAMVKEKICQLISLRGCIVLTNEKDVELHSVPFPSRSEWSEASVSPACCSVVK